MCFNLVREKEVQNGVNFEVGVKIQLIHLFIMMRNKDLNLKIDVIMLLLKYIMIGD
jgi:hypothetical protein